MSLDISNGAVDISRRNQLAWQWRAVGWLIERLRPELGWVAFATALALAYLPMVAFREAGWINLSQLRVPLDWLPLLAVLAYWLMHRATRICRQQSRRWLWRLGQAAVVLGMVLSGAVMLTQVLVRWLPGISAVWQATIEDTWPELWQAMGDDLAQLGLRIGWWWQGVQAGGAAQDDLMFAGIAGLLFWFVGWLTAWLTLRFQSGLLASLPSLWVLSLILYYSSAQRWLMLVGLVLAVGLHLWLDQYTLFRHWEREGTDYNPALMTDRSLTALGIGLMLLVVLALVPNLYIDALVWRAYDAMAPAYEQAESVGKRLFPDLDRPFRGRRGVVVGGLPNSFLLGSGPELSTVQVMRVRTNWPEGEARGSYLRGATFAVYDGRGWENPSGLQRENLEANQAWLEPPEQGRRRMLQSIRLAFRSSILYAAAEPVEPSIDYAAELRGPGDLVALKATTQSYTVLSALPALDDAMLASAAGWGPDWPLPAEQQVHLALPDTITERTRSLADDLTADSDSPFAQAQAIEAYLRSYEYDLDVPEPPVEVLDVADFFLFDLERGYCDYYATAFVVLARLSGLPARFATGYVWGAWDEFNQEWVVSEAEAHSWPEVLLPEYGWIPFEPTAGRPALARVAPAPIPEFPASPEEQSEQVAESGLAWNWQMLFWVLPLGAFLLVVGKALLDYRRSRENPWQALLRWGRRMGRPAHLDETELEYGSDLAGHVRQHVRGEPERIRRIEGAVVDISRAVSAARYGRVDERQDAWERARVHWQTIRK